MNALLATLKRELLRHRLIIILIVLFALALSIFDISIGLSSLANGWLDGTDISRLYVQLFDGETLVFEQSATTINLQNYELFNMGFTEGDHNYRYTYVPMVSENPEYNRTHLQIDKSISNILHDKVKVIIAAGLTVNESYPFGVDHEITLGIDELDSKFLLRTLMETVDPGNRSKFLFYIFHWIFFWSAHASHLVLLFAFYLMLVLPIQDRLSGSDIFMNQLAGGPFRHYILTLASALSLIAVLSLAMAAISFMVSLASMLLSGIPFIETVSYTMQLDTITLRNLAFYKADITWTIFSDWYSDGEVGVNLMYFTIVFAAIAHIVISLWPRKPLPVSFAIVLATGISLASFDDNYYGYTPLQSIFVDVSWIQWIATAVLIGAAVYVVKRWGERRLTR